MELIINTYGTNLGKEGDNFIVVHKDGTQLFNPTKLKSISISKGASITSDAALLALQNEIDVLFVNFSGKPEGRIWGIKFGSISTIRRKQLDFTLSKKAISWIKEIMKQKTDNQIAILLSLNPPTEEFEKYIQKIIRRLDNYKGKINELESELVSDIAANLRGLEGISSKYYFEVLSGILPVEYHSEGRTQHPAMDIFNCLLNYGYGMLYGKIEGALIKAGIDPYIGVFHRDDYNRPVLVYDIIELYRVWIDYVVINILLQKSIDEDCYSKKEDGSYWLENMGKRILIQSVNDYLSEIININGLDRSRQTHIELYAQNLAQIFLKFTI